MRGSLLPSKDYDVGWMYGDERERERESESERERESTNSTCMYGMWLQKLCNV